jgi:hypothetical protein
MDAKNTKSGTAMANYKYKASRKIVSVPRLDRGCLTDFTEALDCLYDCQEELDKECKRLGTLLSRIDGYGDCNMVTRIQLGEVLDDLSRFFETSEINKTALCNALINALPEALDLTSTIRELRKEIREQLAEKEKAKE